MGYPYPNFALLLFFLGALALSPKLPKPETQHPTV